VAKARLNTVRRSVVLLVLVVLGAVGLNVAGAVILKTLADQSNLSPIIFILGLGTAVFINGLRLLVWLFANRWFPLSTTYPLTSIFSPIMLFASYAYNEEVTTAQYSGTILITCGVFWLGWRVKAHEESSG
jgi:multidrug transporter EmrE-like cation transporter